MYATKCLLCELLTLQSICYFVCINRKNTVIKFVSWHPEHDWMALVRQVGQQQARFVRLM